LASLSEGLAAVCWLAHAWRRRRYRLGRRTDVPTGAAVADPAACDEFSPSRLG
jgi:hypothetical protein